MARRGTGGGKGHTNLTQPLSESQLRAAAVYLRQAQQAQAKHARALDLLDKARDAQARIRIIEADLRRAASEHEASKFREQQERCRLNQKKRWILDKRANIHADIRRMYARCESETASGVGSVKEVYAAIETLICEKHALAHLSRSTIDRALGKKR